MKFAEKSSSLLTHAIAKAKLVEFGVSEQDRPKGLKNANDLLYSTIHALSEFSIRYLRGENISENEQELAFASTYYQSFVESEKDEINYIWVLLGACSNLLSDNFGNAKALLGKLKNYTSCENHISKTIVDYLTIIFYGKKKNDNDADSELLEYLRKEITGVEINYDELEEVFRKLYCTIENRDSEGMVFFGVLRAIHKKISSSLAFDSVPQFSNSTREVWTPYFTKKKSIKVLWQAQKLIIENDILNGKDALIQLPTGTGKTKCVELIISAAVLTRDVKLIIYVAPLKALCNEVSKDLYSSLAGIVSVDEVSEVIQDDEEFDFAVKQVLICTPEKLSYLIKNNKEVIEKCGLIIFDEAHMFDDGTRGVTYEVLVAKVKEILPEESQRVFISAVLPNADSINNWATSGRGVLITDELIKKTDKNVGFYSYKNNQILFKLDDGEKRNVFIPNPLKSEPVVLERYKVNRGKIKKDDVKDYFPKKDSGTDVAIALSLKLCTESGVAIYIDSPKQVRTVLERMVKLSENGGLSNTGFIAEEMNKLANLIVLHYGECELSKMVRNGVVPHYGGLPNGIRLAVEHAARNRASKLIVCTSTLAEGVNLPIRYLIMTSFTNSFQEVLPYRKYKNLFGRAARSGTYTEGSLISSDPRVIDDSGKGARFFQWKQILALINDNSDDICSSSILSLCDNILYGYAEKEGYKGTAVINDLIIPKYVENQDVGIAIDELVNTIKTSGIKPSNPLWEMTFISKRNQIVATISILESYIVDELIRLERDADETEAISLGTTFFEKTLAFHLSNDEKKVALTNLFVVITKKVLKVASRKRAVFTKCVLGIDELNDILEYLEANRDELFSSEIANVGNWIECIIRLSSRKYKANKEFEKLTIEKKKELFFAWIQGKSFVEMLQTLHLGDKFGIINMEKTCGNTISFESAMVFSSIIELSSEFGASEFIINQLKSLQKKIQYGLNNREDIFVYERGFSDRVVAQKIGGFLREQASFDETIGVLNIIDNREGIATLLEEFPSYFATELERYE